MESVKYYNWIAENYANLSMDEALALIKKRLPDAWLGNLRINLKECDEVFGIDIKDSIPIGDVGRICASLEHFRDIIRAREKQQCQT